MALAPRHPVWRVSLLWQGTVLDTATIKSVPGKPARTIRLRTGEVLRARVVADAAGDACGALELRGDGVLVTLTPGQLCVLSPPTTAGPVGHAGHMLHADVDDGAAAAPSSGGVDSTMLHATMIGVALQVCVLSALWLAPVGNPSDSGAGVPSEARRWLSLPGGTARAVGKPTFSATGRKADEAEKVEARKRRGAGLPRKPGKGPSLEQTLEAMKRALHPGEDGDLRETLGQLTMAVARAPQLGAGVGGLSPRDPVDTGPGSGVIGAGTTVALDDLLRRRVTDTDQKATPTPRRTTYPVTLQEVPVAAVDGARIDADPELDPVVRDHLTRTIRSRHNVIRGCYEAWGLAADARRSGRLVLELTLLPNGRVENLTAETSSAELRMVGDCVVRAATEWYLGDGLVQAPTRLSFPFVLQPRD